MIFPMTFPIFKKRYMDIYEPLGIEKNRIAHICNDFDKRFSSPKDHVGKYRDLVVAAGEDINARLFAEYLVLAGKKAAYVGPKEAGLLVTPSFGDAQPIDEIALKLAGLKKICSEKIVVFPGIFRGHQRRGRGHVQQGRFRPYRLYPCGGDRRHRI